MDEQTQPGPEHATDVVPAETVPREFAAEDLRRPRAMDAGGITAADARGTRPGAGLRLAAQTTMVGREVLLAEVAELLRTHRLVTLTGVGGVGKSRLAWQFALDGSLLAMDTVESVELSGILDPLQVAQTMARFLGLADRAARSPLDALVEHFAGGPRLLIVDNCEHVVDESAAVLDELLAAAPELTILATSRTALDLPLEVIRRVPPLAVAADNGDEPSAAVSLFVQRVARVAPERSVRAEDVEEITRLCVALDGLPLAIELAAARTRSMSLSDLVDHLDDRFALLATSTRGIPARQRTLEATIDWSYQLCSPLEQRVWRRLSVIVGSFCLDTVTALCASFVDAEAVDASAARPGRVALLDVVDSLVAQSVLSLVEFDGKPRMQMLDSLREFGRRELTRSGELPAAQVAHLDYHVAASADAAARWLSADQTAIVAGNRLLHFDFLRVISYGFERPELRDRVCALVANLSVHWCVGGFVHEGIETVERIAAWTGVSDATRSAALIAGAWAAILLGRAERATIWLDEAEMLAARHGEAGLSAQAVIWRGTLCSLRGDFENAERFFSRAVAAEDDFAVPGTSFLAEFQLTSVRFRLGLPDASEPALRTVAWAESIGEKWIRGFALVSLAVNARARGDVDASVEYARRGLDGGNERTVAAGDGVTVGLLLELIICAAVERGELMGSARLFGALDAHWRDQGVRLTSFGIDTAHAHADAVAAIERALGANRAGELRRQGESLPLADAIRLALEPPEAPVEDRAAALTPREREIVTHVAAGLRNREIAAELQLSPRTIDGHLERIMNKLDLHTRTAVVAWLLDEPE